MRDTLEQAPCEIQSLQMIVDELTVKCSDKSDMISELNRDCAEATEEIEVSILFSCHTISQTILPSCFPHLNTVKRD